MTAPADLTSPTGATRLYPIIGDPIKYVESPTRLSRTLHERGHDGICVPMQVPEDDLATHELLLVWR
jgi:shikimate dehydrogenase